MARATDAGTLALEALYAAIDELNPDLPSDHQLAKQPDTRLYGEEGGLDSLDLVRLVVLYEQAVNRAAAAPVSISDDRAMSEENSHFQTVSTLAAHVTRLLDEAAGG